MEPDFLSQNGEPLTEDQEREWVRERVREGEERGAIWYRVSKHPTMANLILYEGWKIRPVLEGEPRWQMAAVEPILGKSYERELAKGSGYPITGVGHHAEDD